MWYAIQVIGGREETTRHIIGHHAESSMYKEVCISRYRASQKNRVNDIASLKFSRLIILLPTHTIQGSSARIEKGKLKILPGSPHGREADVVHDDRRHRRATVRMQFMGREKAIILGLEILGKSPEWLSFKHMENLSARERYICRAV